MASEPLLELRELSVLLGGSPRLQSINFSLGSGEVASVVGANGAGKTSLLRAIAGDFRRRPANSDGMQGSVLVEGRPTDAMSPRQRALCVAMLAQQSTLNFPFLVREVIALGRTPHDSGVQRDSEIVEQYAEAFDVSHLLGRSYTGLSGGERQRVQLARVFVQLACAVAEDEGHARLLLLDEPMAALDYRHQRQVAAAITAFAGQQNVAVLQVMHDVNLAAAYSSRMLALVDGRLYCDAGVSDFMNEETINAVFDMQAEVIHHPANGRAIVV